MIKNLGVLYTKFHMENRSKFSLKNFFLYIYLLIKFLKINDKDCSSLISAALSAIKEERFFVALLVL